MLNRHFVRNTKDHRLYLCFWYRDLQNVCRERHLTRNSPLNFDLTLKACVAGDVARIATLDISNGGSYRVASSGACLQVWESTNRTSVNHQKWVQSSEVSRMVVSQMTLVTTILQNPVPVIIQNDL